MKSSYQVAKLGNHVHQVSSRNRSGAEIEVFSVTNSEGFTRSTEYFSKEVFSKDISNYKVVKPSQFAYNPSRINVGSIDYLRYPSSVLVSPLYIVFECNNDIHKDYLLRYLKSDWGNTQIRANTEGAVRDSLKYKGLENIKFPLAPLNDQIRIAHLLGKVEGMVAQRKQHLQQLDDLMKSVFLEMFGDPVRTEKGWDKKPLSTLGDLDRGVSKHRPRNAPELLGGKYPLIQTGDVSKSGTYIDGFTQTYSELGFAQSKLWPTGTLCITIAANIAQTGILTFDACFPDSVVGFTAKVNETNPLYVFGLFWFFQRILEKNAPAAAQKNINLKILRELEVPAPPKELQDQFATIVEKVEALKSRYKQSLSDLETLYGALSQQAFKGELDLSQVPLAGSSTGAQVDSEAIDEVATAIPETKAQAADILAIHLPESDALPDALTDKAKRKDLFAFWLESYCQQIGNTVFSANDFIAAAQTRISEQQPDNEFELGLEDYEQIKHLVFQALNNGHLQQAQNVTGQDENGEPILGNRVELNAGVKP